MRCVYVCAWLYAPTGTGAVCVCVRCVCPALGPGGPEEFFTIDTTHLSVGNLTL